MQKALQEAKTYRVDLLLWAEGSKSNTEKTGAAVVWKDNRLNKWQEKRRYLGKPFDAELWAIPDALEISIRETSINPTAIIISTGSKVA